MLALPIMLASLISMPPSDISVSGHGPGAVPIELEPGLTIFNWTHDGSSWFDVDLLDVNGSDRRNLVLFDGTFNGSNAILVLERGIYAIDIDADGNWTLNVTQLINEELAA